MMTPAKVPFAHLPREEEKKTSRPVGRGYRHAVARRPATIFIAAICYTVILSRFGVAINTSTVILILLLRRLRLAGRK